MKKLFTLFALIFTIVFMVSCGGSSNTNIDDVPPWYLVLPKDPNYIFGTAVANSKNLELAVDKASQDARAKISLTIETNVQGLIKKFDEEVGVKEDSHLLQLFTQATQSVIDQMLNGSVVVEKAVFEDGDIYKAYTLVQYPVGAANEAFMKQIKNREELYTRYRSSKTFEELDKEVQKYREWKEKQGL